MKTMLKKLYEKDGVWICDVWEIPEAGAEVWCTAWRRGQFVKPCGDGFHIIVGFSVYHCSEFVRILSRNEKDGFEWGIEGAKMTRRQKIAGNWEAVSI